MVMLLVRDLLEFVNVRDILGKGCGDEDRGEPANATDEGGISSVEVLVADVFVLFVSTAVHDNAEDDEDLGASV